MTLEREYNDLIKSLSKTLQKQNVTIGRTVGLRGDSNLLKSFQTRQTTKRDAIRFVANDYFIHYSKGRRSGSRKVPVRDLVNWINRYGITSPTMTTNQLAFAIQTSIFKSGIQPTNIREKITNAMLDTSQKTMADEMEKNIADEIVNNFKI